MLKVNKEKCIGCGLCAADCPEGFVMNEEGKAEMINEENAKNCGGTKLCPQDAIENV